MAKPNRLFFISLLATLALCHPSLHPSSHLNAPSRFLKKKFKTVSGKRMAYVEVGKGDPIVFLHGDPTSSFIWRNIMPHLEGKGRIIAPDLIGMGDSDKLDNIGPNSYTFVNHTNYLFQLLEQLGVKERVTLVMHDWGSALGFFWAYCNQGNPKAIKGIAFLEGIAAPFESFDDLPPGADDFFKLIRGPEGERLMLEENSFIESFFPDGIMRNLTEEEMTEYRRPFLKPEDRRPTLTWPRQFPIEGEPADVTALVSAYSTWMSTTKFPKLFVNVEPGIMSTFLRTAIQDWTNVTEVTVKGLHYVQEDSPHEIGAAVADWLP